MSAPPATIAPLEPRHWPAVEAIWAAGIAGGHATFEPAPPTWGAFDAGRLPGQRWVALDGHDEVLGWVAASPTSTRPAYRGVVEHSVYVAPSAAGRGVGRLLLEALAASTEAAGIWTVQSAVFPENAASLALHARCGFRVVGRRERVALMPVGPLAGRWRDTVLVERRSRVVGV
ncbi:GNAT family N-acetyltransferase [Lapillicoccus jejuensis]|uniref:Phosphinothricin acetyltransferase n=1 Tax=Lapillicoccus jejuensis TaxID=402171 RepID=A0A542DXD7_9MICO|nr:GNAT family N-acetyltransferase [Lapillicoccus jejuensis]TQJ07748.1 phosphinothricin acetyltransferase [Lapillicoccus jejuensis]